jgi:hypothetical protein
MKNSIDFLEAAIMRKCLGPLSFLVVMAALCTINISTSFGQVVRTGVGANAASIQAAVDTFRADLGVNNGLGPCSGPCAPGVGRREINWDAVPDAFSSGGGTPFPGNFFNLAAGNPLGRVRGAEFTTTGAFEVSADADSDNDGNPGPTPILFGNRSPDNATDFEAFSAERIFGLVGTNLLDVKFSVPGSPASPALVRGFGAIFTDVELANSTKMEYFDSSDTLLHTQSAPEFVFAGGDSGKSFSFAGVSFPDAIVSRVRITNGGYDLNLTQFGADDAVAMDDFIYGEPILVPEPVLSWLGFAASLGLLARLRRG